MFDHESPKVSARKLACMHAVRVCAREMGVARNLPGRVDVIWTKCPGARSFLPRHKMNLSNVNVHTKNLISKFFSNGF